MLKNNFLDKPPTGYKCCFRTTNPKCSNEGWRAVPKIYNWIMLSASYKMHRDNLNRSHARVFAIVIGFWLPFLAPTYYVLHTTDIRIYFKCESDYDFLP